ncbi:lysozyme, putative [Entamoeba dispar SAW760]|uniref:lysozyme n=1 Tax=Entamoeba dispar (strain ATCC PRA-260 / SAW760) TaxID=370354 RepID=B0EU49_ENTDS|nr:lysozyme, putative [Entamoeba dispar SAW760]EDR21966.1 lysozyme, putative [Entamoeba dispar SAW760]|eukprot:EDR21966.1 lysozyme, putative [Entamoeba dispar SAW760]
MLFFTLLIASVFAIRGVDMSTLTSVSSFQCFVNNGYTFAIPRCWRSTGSWDPYCANNCANAHAGGMSRVDAYFFPCYSCGNAAGQVNSFWQKVVSNQLKITTVWFDIEGTWSSSYTANQQFFMEMMNQARAIGIVHGVYVSQHYWNSFFGSSYIYPYASSTPLWYPHYDHNPSFSDFSSFGGWSTPAIKQYQGTTSMCSASVDLSYQP